MYQTGKTVAEVANERGLSPTTIESHLAHYVGLGELDVTLFISKGKLDKIVQYFKSVENKSFGAAKAALGEDVSYSDLRMGLSYLESLNKKETD